MPDSDEASFYGAIDEAQRFAREHLGPSSAHRLGLIQERAVFLSVLKERGRIEDAVLAWAKQAAATDAGVADEFAASFLRDLARIGRRMRRDDLKRYLDTGDLVQSALGDIWPDLQSIKFETRGRFLAYLAKRLGWKAGDRRRQLRSARRAEDRRVHPSPSEWDVASTEDSPSTLAAADEEQERLALLLVRLPERERDLTRLLLEGRPLPEIASQLGLSYNATRMAIQRAIRKARRMAE